MNDRHESTHDKAQVDEALGDVAAGILTLQLYAKDGQMTEDWEDLSNHLTQDVIMLQKKVDELPNKSSLKDYDKKLARVKAAMHKKDDEISHLQSKVSFLKTDLVHATKAYFKQDEKMTELKKVLTGYHQVIAQKDIEMAKLLAEKELLAVNSAKAMTATSTVLTVKTSTRSEHTENDENSPSTAKTGGWTRRPHVFGRSPNKNKKSGKPKQSA